MGNSQIFQNSLRFLAFTEVTDLFINVSIVSVVVMNLGVTYIIYPIQMDKIESQAVIYILIAFTTFAVTKSFFMVYQMACKTIFICFLEDERRNDGSKSRPYAMSVDLFKLLTTVQPKIKQLCRSQRTSLIQSKGSLGRLHRPWEQSE